jgi:hypothetical protein
MANWGSGPATPGAPSRFALSGRTSHRGCREVSGDWRTWVLWFNVPAQSRRVAVAMPVPLGCRLRHRGAIRECLVARGHRTGQVCAGAGGAGGRFTWRATDPGGSRLMERAAANAAAVERAQRRAVVPFYRAWILAQRALRSRRPKRPAAGHLPHLQPGASSMMLARVRGTAPHAWSTVSCMVSSFRFGGGWDLGPAGRTHASAGPLS